MVAVRPSRTSGRSRLLCGGHGLHHRRHAQRPPGLVRFSAEYSLGPNDAIIVLGDTGFNCYLHGRDARAKKLASRIPAKLLCIHGNHEALRFLAPKGISAS